MVAILDTRESYLNTENTVITATSRTYTLRFEPENTFYHKFFDANEAYLIFSHGALERTSIVYGQDSSGLFFRIQARLIDVAYQNLYLYWTARIPDGQSDMPMSLVVTIDFSTQYRTINDVKVYTDLYGELAVTSTANNEEARLWDEPDYCRHMLGGYFEDSPYGQGFKGRLANFSVTNSILSPQDIENFLSNHGAPSAAILETELDASFTNGYRRQIQNTIIPGSFADYFIAEEPSQSPAAAVVLLSEEITPGSISAALYDSEALSADLSAITIVAGDMAAALYDDDTGIAGLIDGNSPIRELTAALYESESVSASITRTLNAEAALYDSESLSSDIVDGNITQIYMQATLNDDEVLAADISFAVNLAATLNDDDIGSAAISDGSPSIVELAATLNDDEVLAADITFALNLAAALYDDDTGSVTTAQIIELSARWTAIEVQSYDMYGCMCDDESSSTYITSRPRIHLSYRN